MSLADFDFQFTTLQDSGQLRGLIDFIAGQDVRYPNYDGWVEKAEHELDVGYKNAILAYSDGRLVGDIIFQRHKSIPSLLEIKNLRVDPKLKSRYFARFMLRQLESEARKKDDYQALIVDARADQKEVVSFFLSSRFSPIITLPLYNPGIDDVVMVKNLD